VEEDVPVSFLLPARRQQDVIIKTEEPKPVPASAGSRASRFMKSQEPDKAPRVEEKPDRTADKTALLAGILNGMKPAAQSPMTTPAQVHAVAGAAQGQSLGMPMFFATPPPPGIGSPGVGQGGKSSEHMDRLLGMLKGDAASSGVGSPVMGNAPPMQVFGGDAQERTFGRAQPERTFSGPPGIDTAPVGRQSRFFKGSTTPSAVQSPVEAPAQVNRASKQDEMRQEETPMQSVHASPQRAQYNRDPRHGIESARSPVEHHLAPPPGFPQGASPGVEMHNRPFTLGPQPPMEMMSPMRGHQTTLDDPSRQASMFPGPLQHQMGPPAFWQGPAPPQGMPLGMMHSPQPPPPLGFMSPPHVFQQPPPGMMPPPFGAYVSPVVGHGQPGMPFGMPPPHVHQMPPPPPTFQHGYPAPGQGMPHPHQQQSMTHDLMNLLGSMQSKN
jgi:hypothetical protein